MATRKWLLAGAAVVTLAAAGCASDPYYYDNAYYNNGYYDNTVVYRDYPYRYYDYPAARYYSYGPGYYVAQPSLSLGFGYHRYR
jgi:hypothetical protein